MGCENLIRDADPVLTVERQYRHEERRVLESARTRGAAMAINREEIIEEITAHVRKFGGASTEWVGAGIRV